MKIQFNTDKTISGHEKRENYFTSYIAEELYRFESHLSRIEVHLSDESGKKGGPNDIQCLMEARIEHRQPIAVSNSANTLEEAVSGATDKLKAALTTIVGRIQNH